MQKIKQYGSRVTTLTMEAGIFLLGMIPFGQKVIAQCDPGEGGIQSGADCAQPTGTPTDLFGSDGLFRQITNILIFLIGAVSVVMLIIGGFRYVLSGGDSGSVEGAKNTILYAIIGIVVAFLAYAAVTFVISSLSD